MCNRNVVDFVEFVSRLFEVCSISQPQSCTMIHQNDTLLCFLDTSECCGNDSDVPEGSRVKKLDVLNG